MKPTEEPTGHESPNLDKSCVVCLHTCSSFSWYTIKSLHFQSLGNHQEPGVLSDGEFLGSI